MSNLGPSPAHLSADSVEVLERLDREDTLAELWVERDRERAQEAREWTVSKREREAA